MKRGFLLSPPKKSRNSTKTLNVPSSLPQCQSSNDEEAPNQPQRRVVTTSSDLLDLNNGNGASSLFQLVGEQSNITCVLPASIVDANRKPPSDSRVRKNCGAQTPLITEVDTTANFNNQQNYQVHTAKPLVLEVNESLMPNHQSAGDVACTADNDDRETPSGHGFISQYVPKPQQNESEGDILLFANELSLLLTRLHRQMMSKNRMHKFKQNDEYFFNGMYMNIKTEMEVKSFIEKHFILSSAIRSKLAELMRQILEPIAQDYSGHIALQQKKRKSLPKTTTYWNSPSLAVGLGILAYFKQNDLIYACLEDSLLGAVNAISEQLNIDYRKHKKTVALGAVYLLRCWVRTLCVHLSRLELFEPSSNDTSFDININAFDAQFNSCVILSKILPALETIIVSEAKRTVLTTAAMDGCFEVLELSARLTVLQQSSILSLMILWRDFLPAFDRLLVVKQEWVTQSSNCRKKDECGKHEAAATSRSKCSTAILKDWRELLNVSKGFFDDFLLKDKCTNGHVQNRDNCDLLINLAGSVIQNKKSQSDHASMEGEVVILRVGGIAQSLCHHQECTIGFVTCSCIDHGGNGDVPDLTVLLKKSIQQRTGQKSASSCECSSVGWKIAIRAIVSWLAKSKLDSKTSEIEPDLVEQAMDMFLSFLQLDSNPCCDDSIIASM